LKLIISCGHIAAPIGPATSSIEAISSAIYSLSSSHLASSCDGTGIALMLYVAKIKSLHPESFASLGLRNRIVTLKIV
jgi:hypothetical protein